MHCINLPQKMGLIFEHQWHFSTIDSYISLEYNSIMTITTGWFGIPNTQRRGVVHLVMNRKPVCGTRISKKAIYQWCANHIVIDYVECERCRSIHDKKQKLIGEYQDILKELEGWL